MKEYEKGVKVKDITPFIDYCVNNNYEFVSKQQQNRKVYENQNAKHIIARITTFLENGEEKIVFDCKNFSSKSEHLTVSKESEEMLLTHQTQPIVENMLETLEFKLSANNNRTRYVYKNDSVKFEIDDYTTPNMKVVAIEGEDAEVEKIYEEITANLEQHIIKL